MTTGYLSGTTLGRYRIGALLGRGGMGEVYRAEDSELRRAVALKVLPQALTGDEERLARFVHEARTASALNHPHLVTIYDIGQGAPGPAHQPVHFIAMELVSGDTLREIFDRRNVDLRRLLEYASQAADALAAAHGAGIVHRDLKPENIMVADAGYAKVLDFGLAKLRVEPELVEAAGASPTVSAGTAPGMVMGTVGYMSPEQAQGRPVDHRTDVFSFGCVLYEAATGIRAFSGPSAVETLHRIIHLDPAPVAQLATGVPAELQRIIQKCLQKDPEERYQSMKDVAVDLRSLRRQLDSGSAPISLVGVPAKRKGTPAMAIAAGALVLLVAGAFLARQWLRAPGPQQPISIQRLTDTGTVIDAIVSADGKYIAYVDSSLGKQGLYLRQVTGTRAVELVAPAVVGFWGITFSNDGQSIYYAVKSRARSTGELFQIPVLGGTPQSVLVDIDSPITFAPDGSQFAFYRADLGPKGVSSIVIAAADGSNQRVLTSKQAPEFFAPGFFVAPSWSPDGKRIAACVRNSSSRSVRLVTIDVGSGAETSFPDRFMFGSFTRWTPDGSAILFIAVPPGGLTTGNGGQIYRQPYPSGAPQRVTNDLIEYRNISSTGDGRSIVSVGFDISSRLSLLPYGGVEERRPPGSRYDGASGLVWAPDGSRFVFGRVNQTQRAIWSAAADGSDMRQLTSEGIAAWPAVSPDGKILVYFGIRGQEAGLWRSGPSGENPHLLTRVSDPSSVVFAPDGQSIYFTSSRGGAPATYRLGVEGGEPALVAPLLERAAPSRDGTRLAGVYRENPRAALMLGIIDAKTGKPLKTFADFNPASGSGTIKWVDGDKALLYTTVERSNVWRRTIADGREEKVTNFSDLSILRFDLSPDGRTLLLCRGTMSRDALLISNVR